MYRPIGKNKSVAVKPIRILWIRIKESATISSQQKRYRLLSAIKSHRENRMWAAGAMPIGAPICKGLVLNCFGLEKVQTGVARIAFEDDIRCQCADGRNGDIISMLADKHRIRH
jgi:hypothetical protein